MKIGKNIIQNRKISIYTDWEFDATYKKHWITISAYHGWGDPEEDHLTRFVITVRCSEGMYAVDTYDDFETIEEAIAYAIEGAMLS